MIKLFFLIQFLFLIILEFNFKLKGNLTKLIFLKYFLLHI